VFFDKGKATLDAEASRLLKGFAPPIKEGPNPVDVTGYAVRGGNRAANLAIANRRAAAVRDMLIAEGIAADRIRLQTPREVSGAGRERDARRVELTVGQ
jgi:outer membrane protein OmpA-like peptidoglycan-associated protein